jgi:hypothetical protein
LSATAIPPLDPAATALFAACEETWDDEGRHDKFVRYCSAAGLLASAARQYRLYLDCHPGDAVAVRVQQRIVAMASLQLTTHQPAREPVTRSRGFVVIVALAAVAGVLAAIFLG